MKIELKIKMKGKNELVSVLNSLRTESGIDISYISPIPVESDGRLKKSGAISLWALIGSLAGIIVTAGFIYWTMAKDYPINIGGKPFFSIVYSVPVIFEISILFTLFFALAAFLFKAGLPDWHEEEEYSDDFLLVLSGEKNIIEMILAEYKLDDREKL